jgi:2'-5' RNA ligase
MKRAIHIFPALAELADIEAIRTSYDPLAGKIAPHVTLVFPFDIAVSVDDLAAHVRRTAGMTEPFEMTLGRAESKDNGYVWFPVVKGRMQVLCLHDRLYSGVLGEFRSAAHVYEPHMTVAQGSESKVTDALRATQNLNIVSAAWIDRVVVERILQHDVSEIENTIMLTGK